MTLTQLPIDRTQKATRNAATKTLQAITPERLRQLPPNCFVLEAEVLTPPRPFGADDDRDIAAAKVALADPVRMTEEDVRRGLGL